MKKLLLSVIAIFALTQIGYAQDVGQKWVGGSLNISSSKITGGDRTTGFKLMPEIGFQFKDNIAFGVSLGYLHGGLSMLNSPGDFDNFDFMEGRKLNMYTIAPFVRLSLYKQNIVNLFVDAGLSYGYGKFIGGGPKMHAFDIGFRPGFQVKLSDKFGVTAKIGFIGYDQVKMKPEGMESIKSDSFGLNFDMSQFMFGVSYVF